MVLLQLRKSIVGVSPDCAEERAIALLLQRFHCLLWQRYTRVLEGPKPCLEIHEGEVELEGARESFEDAAAGGYDLAANAVAGYQTCQLISVELV